MTNEQAEIQQAAREFLDEYPYHLRIRDGEHKLAIAQFAAAFHISRSEEERKRIQELEQEHEDLRNDLSSAIDLNETLEAEVAQLRGALEQSGWEKVEDSLPSGNEMFLVSDGKRVMVAAFWPRGCNGAKWTYMLKPVSVTHWQPLPSPPASAEREVKG